MPIPRGHKFALRAVARGRAGPQVRLADRPRDGATSRAARTSTRTTWRRCSPASTSIDSAPRARSATAHAAAERATFMGYRRADGRVGTRNEIWILCTVGCVGRTAERIARLGRSSAAQDRVDGVYAFPHQFGCSQLGDDLDRTRKLIAALARHPNAGGVLILGLGCESNQLEPLLQEIPQSQRERIRTFAAQATADEIEEGLARRRGAGATSPSATEREPCPVCDARRRPEVRRLGRLQRHHRESAASAASPIASPPPAARRSSPRFPEIFGAEQLLMERAADEQVFDGIVERRERLQATTSSTTTSRCTRTPRPATSPAASRRWKKNRSAPCRRAATQP